MRTGGYMEQRKKVNRNEPHLYGVKRKRGKWYAHAADTPHLPISGSHGDKKHALKVAANLMGIPLKEYMKIRKAVG